jgi:hypothetical protein
MKLKHVAKCDDCGKEIAESDYDDIEDIIDGECDQCEGTYEYGGLQPYNPYDNIGSEKNEKNSNNEEVGNNIDNNKGNNQGGNNMEDNQVEEDTNEVEEVEGDNNEDNIKEDISYTVTKSEGGSDQDKADNQGDKEENKPGIGYEKYKEMNKQEDTTEDIEDKNTEDNNETEDNIETKRKIESDDENNNETNKKEVNDDIEVTEYNIDDLIQPNEHGRVTNGEMIPALKNIIDNNNDKQIVEKINLVKKNYPTVYQSSLKYIGKKRNNKLDELMNSIKTLEGLENALENNNEITNITKDIMLDITKEIVTKHGWQDVEDIPENDNFDIELVLNTPLMDNFSIDFNLTDFDSDSAYKVIAINDDENKIELFINPHGGTITDGKFDLTDFNNCKVVKNDYTTFIFEEIKNNETIQDLQLKFKY